MAVLAPNVAGLLVAALSCINCTVFSPGEGLEHCSFSAHTITVTLSAKAHAQFVELLVEYGQSPPPGLGLRIGSGALAFVGNVSVPSAHTTVPLTLDGLSLLVDSVRW
jgi:hypothetical protein